MISAFGKNLRKNLEMKLHERGISLRSTDLAALIEARAPKSSRAALGFALDLIRPFTAGMGLRISRLSDQNIEMILPVRKRNEAAPGRIHEGAMLTAALEAARLLWLRHAPHGEFSVQLKEATLQILQDYEGDLILRMELQEMQRETVLMQLRRHQQATPGTSVNIFDSKKKAIGKIEMTLHLVHIPMLAGS
jgi:hypothetical protein